MNFTQKVICLVGINCLLNSPAFSVKVGSEEDAPNDKNKSSMVEINRHPCLSHQRSISLGNFDSRHLGRIFSPNASSSTRERHYESLPDIQYLLMAVELLKRECQTKQKQVESHKILQKKIKFNSIKGRYESRWIICNGTYNVKDFKSPEYSHPIDFFEAVQLDPVMDFLKVDCESPMEIEASSVWDFVVTPGGNIVVRHIDRAPVGREPVRSAGKIWFDKKGEILAYTETSATYPPKIRYRSGLPNEDFGLMSEADPEKHLPYRVYKELYKMAVKKGRENGEENVVLDLSEWKEAVEKQQELNFLRKYNIDEKDFFPESSPISSKDK